jgi:hypothetical protein
VERGWVKNGTDNVDSVRDKDRINHEDSVRDKNRIDHEEGECDLV